MRVGLVIVTVALLTGCGSQQHATSEPGADINAAAEAAQGDIDTYAANALAPTPPVATAPVRPMPIPTTATTPAMSASPDDTSTDGQAAVAVVTGYYWLIAERKFDHAYQLWEDGGRASGMSQHQFADSFARYADYRAKVGGAGQVDAGAGQRYVEVPVRIAGRLADRRRPFAMAGALVLHRTADIDGATAEQRQWRIRNSSIRPRPADPTEARTRTASYRCAGETRISVRFDEAADTATIRRDGRDVAVLEGQRPASGIWYKGDGYELRGKDRDANYAAPGVAPIGCTAD